jgi:hypothetical protein
MKLTKNIVLLVVMAFGMSAFAQFDSTAEFAQFIDTQLMLIGEGKLELNQGLTRVIDNDMVTQIRENQNLEKDFYRRSTGMTYDPIRRPDGEAGKKWNNTTKELKKGEEKLRYLNSSENLKNYQYSNPATTNNTSTYYNYNGSSSGYNYQNNSSTSSENSTYSENNSSSYKKTISPKSKAMRRFVKYAMLCDGDNVEKEYEKSSSYFTGDFKDLAKEYMDLKHQNDAIENNSAKKYELERNEEKMSSLIILLKAYADK